MERDSTPMSDRAQQEKYIILSAITRRPFINESRQSYLFTDKADAKTFGKRMKHEKVIYKNVSDEKLKSICSWCYSAGAEYIIIDEEGKRSIRRLSERHLDKNYYNCRLSADLALLMHTKKTKYVADLEKCEFVVPIRITNGDSVSIVYATAMKEDRDMFIYLSFTDLNEYKKWADKVKDGWEPLAVDVGGLKRIGKKHGFMINPFSERFILTGEILKQLKSEEEEDDD